MTTEMDEIIVTKAEYRRLLIGASLAEGVLRGIGFRLRAIVKEEEDRITDRTEALLLAAADDAEALSKVFAPKEEEGSSKGGDA